MNTAYPLIPVTIIILAAYGSTWLFSKWGIFSKKSHRKFWNVLLLVAFLVSGLLGIFSVIKINWKLEIPNYDNYLKWHVAFGIGLVIISLFHLSWHLKYYLTWRKKTVQSGKPKIHAINELVPFRYLLLLLGSIAIINQMLFIREFMSVLGGNELVLGVVMAGWMLITGWGAWSARKQIPSGFNLTRGLIMLAFLALIPALLIGLLYELKSLLFPPGTITGLSVLVPGILLLLFPVCFLSGYLFTAFSALFSETQNKNLIGKAYAWESIGSLVGGLIFSIILGRFFNTLQVIGLTTGAILISGSWLVWKNSKRKRVIFLLSGLILPVVVFVTHPDVSIKKILYPSQQIVLDKSTRYGNLIVTQQAGQLNFYENNALQFYTENLMNNEEAVHFAMVQHKNPQKVLLISGGISGMIKEIQKYNQPEITYLETNPEIFRYWKKVAKESEIPENVEIVKSDIRTFLQRTSAIYNVILINLPAPSTLGYNRFYTREFWGIIKRHCNAESIVCTTLPTTANYAESSALDVNASLWKTMGLWFKHQLILPGEKNYFLASDAPLSSNIVKLVEAQKVENEYVNPYYFNDDLLTRRSNLLETQMQKETQINRDFKPFMFIKQTGHWLSYFGTRYYILVLIPAVLFLLLFLRTNGVTAGLYTGGFTAASLEITLLLAYQIFVGSIYLATAFFFTAFMGGLAAGSLLNYRISENQLPKSYYLLQFALAAFALLLPLFIHLTDKVSGWIIVVQILFFVLTFALAFGIGFEFYLASKLQKLSLQETSGINYSTDLAGSAFGAFLTAIVLLPVLGLLATCIIVAGLNVMSGSWAAFGLKSRIF